MDQHAAAVDEWRRAIAMEPKNIYPRVWLSLLLTTSPDPNIRNGQEALALLEEYESQIAELPIIAMALATAAAETGDFNRAVKMQEKYISLLEKPEQLKHARAALELHRKKVRTPYFFDEPEMLSEVERRQVLEQGVVLVRVRGRIQHEDHTKGFCWYDIVEREHAGTVIDNKGLVLVSASTIGIVPAADDIVRPNQTSDWLEGPFIDVYQLDGIGRAPKLIGAADILGLDQPTGVGVIQIQRDNSLEPIQGLGTIRMQSVRTSRSRDGASYYGLDMPSDPPPAIPEDQAVRTQVTRTNARPIGTLKYEVTTVDATEDIPAWHRQSPLSGSPIQVSTCVEMLFSKLRIGSPVINEAGECVAIVSPIISRKKQERLTGIPAHVLHRVASKLVSYGLVQRAELPIEVSAMAKEKGEGSEAKLVGGMQVTDVYSRDNVYRELQDQVILSVDGMPTPTTSDWLIALERAHARGTDVLRCEVTDSAMDVIRIMLIPIQR